jgi:ABC-type xylose transport system permease subunit
VGLIKDLGINIAGLGISGCIGLVSSVLMLYVLVDAMESGAEEPVWLFICVVVGLIIGALSFKLFRWANRRPARVS